MLSDFRGGYAGAPGLARQQLMALQGAATIITSIEFGLLVRALHGVMRSLAEARCWAYLLMFGCGAEARCASRSSRVSRLGSKCNNPLFQQRLEA